MAVSNGFDLTVVLAALKGRLGWQQPTESGYNIVNTANQASTSGRYYNNGFHASCTIQNIYDTQPDKDITPEAFNALVSEMGGDVAVSMLNMVYDSPQLIESHLLYKKCDNTANRAVTNTGKFCGLRFSNISEGCAVMLNNVLLHFDADTTVKLYLFNEFKTVAVETWDIPVTANQQKVFNLNQVINNSSTELKGGTWFLGYFQDELTNGAKAIDFSPERIPFLKFNAMSFEANKVGADDFKRNEYSSSWNMYGLNVEASSYRDLTNEIVQNAHQFDELQGLIMASRVMELIINSTRSSYKQRITQEIINVYYRELNSVTTSENPFQGGIKSKIKAEVKRIRESFKPKKQASVIQPTFR